MNKIFLGGQLLWLAWYPKRGARCHLSLRDENARDGRWHASAAIGPLYLGVGPGIPLP